MLFKKFLKRYFLCEPFLKSLLNLLQYCFCFWFFGQEAYGVLAPGPEIKPNPPALEGEVLITGPPGKSLHPAFQKILSLFIKINFLFEN